MVNHDYGLSRDSTLKSHESIANCANSGAYRRGEVDTSVTFAER